MHSPAFSATQPHKGGSRSGYIIARMPIEICHLTVLWESMVRIGERHGLPRLSTILVGATFYCRA